MDLNRHPAFAAAPHRRWPAGAAVAFALTVGALAVCLSLTGCGGAGDDADFAQRAALAERGFGGVEGTHRFDARRESDYGPGDAPGTTTHGTAAASMAVPTAATDRSAVPVDRLAHTGRGRYVSRSIAERTDQEVGGQVIWIDAGCCAGQAGELPEQIVFGMQAVLGNEAPIFVFGADLRQAARLVDRLDRRGLGPVYLVTP